MIDDQAVRPYLLYAVQAVDAEILVVDELAQGDHVHLLRQAFWDHHALPCGFCLVCLLRDCPYPVEPEIHVAFAANLCRCARYQNIVRAVTLAAEQVGNSSYPVPMAAPRQA